MIENNPWIGELINIQPQTAIPHTIENRCWESHLWEGDPYHIEWCRWLPESKDPKLLRTTVHLAFEVDCVETEVKKYDAKEVFLKPFVPFEGVKVAFILYEGQLIEFLEKTG